MSKQMKVLNKIKGSLVQSNEGRLGKKNNDECYTSMQTIIDELYRWGALGKFKGKRIICPCDWDIADDNANIYSITIEYAPDFKVAGNSVFKGAKVIYSLFDDDDELTNTSTEITLAEDEVEDFLRDKLTCNFIRTLTQMARKWGIKSITASGYNPATNKGVKFQDVDYYKYDICITNPPFSLYGEFMKAIVGKIDFIVLAPFLNRVNPCVGEYLVKGQAYLGFGVDLALDFNNPTKDNQFRTKSVACDWITSYSEAQEERNNEHFRSGVKYEDYKDEWPEMPNMTMKDGTHPIRVSRSTYPEDFDGWMFAAIGVLDNLDQSEYEFYITNCKGYYNSHPELNPFSHKLTNTMINYANGKNGFHGVVFRKKKH